MFDLKTWLISPRDPLIFRNGKPFTAAPGSRAETLPMPFPGTISGAVRTKAGTDPLSGKFDVERIKDHYNVQGPLLIELDNFEKVKEWFFPTPADAVFFESNEKDKGKKVGDCYDLKPMNTPSGIFLDKEDLVLCGFEKNIKAKPFKSPPAFWSWKTLEKWLLQAVSKAEVELETVGINQLPVQNRVHVAMNNKSQSAKDGALFQTSAIEFENKVQNESSLRDVRRFGLAVLTDLNLPDSGLGFLGGERRLVDWLFLETEIPFKSCPEKIRDEIVESGFCRLLLASPAYFNGSSHPSQALQVLETEVIIGSSEPTNVLQDTGAKIIAMVNNRFQTVSGWDYQSKTPKPTKRLVPAGSVLFLKLSDEREERKLFIERVWMKNIGDDFQMCSAGYGLSLLGTWDGNLRSMNMEESDD